MESGLEGWMRLRWKEMEFQGEVRAGAPLGGECGQVAAPSGGALTGKDMLEDTWKDLEH